MKVWFLECSGDYAKKFYFIKKYDLFDISKMGDILQNLIAFLSSATPNYHFKSQNFFVDLCNN